MLARVAVARGQLHHRLRQRRGIERHVVRVLLVHGVVGENQRQLPQRRRAQRRVAQQERMVRVHDVRREFLERAGQVKRHGQDHRKIAAVEMLQRRHAHHPLFVFRRALELRRHHQHLVPPLAIGPDKTRHRLCDAAHVRKIGIRHHHDMHGGAFLAVWRPGSDTLHRGARTVPPKPRREERQEKPRPAVEIGYTCMKPIRFRGAGSGLEFPLHGVAEQLVAGFESELVLDALAVGFDGLHAEMKLVGNLPRCQPFAQSLEDLQFPVG